MITKAFRDAMKNALKREVLPEKLEEVCPFIAENLPNAEREGTSMVILVPVCWLIEYNEAVPVPERTPADRVSILNAASFKDLMSLKLPETFVAAIQEAVQIGNPAYQFFNKYFKETAFDGRSIVRIGLGLHMTADEVNQVLLSYGKQTVSWHRVDDLLYRYALGKGWSYDRFERVLQEYLSYRASEEKEMQQNLQPSEMGNPTFTGQTDQRTNLKEDSAYLTRFNRKKLEGLMHLPDTENDAKIYKMLHAYFIETERMADGAPRRCMAKLSRFAHGQFSAAYTAELLGRETSSYEAFGDCPISRAIISYQMLMEAAGEQMSLQSQYRMNNPREASELVNRVIHVINDMSSGFKEKEHPKLPWTEGQEIGDEYFRSLKQWNLEMVLQPDTMKDSEALSLTANCLYRDLPQEYRADPRIRRGGDAGTVLDTDLILIATSIALNRQAHNWEDDLYFENALRQGVFHLLLCCGNSKARHILNMTIRDTLVCLGWTESTLKIGKTQIVTFPDEKMLQILEMLQYTAEQKYLFLKNWDEFVHEGKEACFNSNLRKQYITERDINEPVSGIMNTGNPVKKEDKNTDPNQDQMISESHIELNKRNNEPSRALILFMALYMFGFAFEKDERSFTKDNCERFISDYIQYAWASSWQLSKLDDQTDSTVDQIIDHTFSQYKQLQRQNPYEKCSDRWLKALQTACREYRTECRDAEIRSMERYKTFDWSSEQILATQNELFLTSLTAGQWKYMRESRRTKRRNASE